MLSAVQWSLMDLRTAAEDIYDSRGDLQQFGVGFVGSSVWGPFPELFEAEAMPSERTG